jgi:carboxyl-terminal processing protease
LINGNSASASEIMAWALRDYNKTILVWEKSYGKWSVQQPFEFDDGGLLKITIAKWYTPNDKSIDGVGIEPDIEIEFLDEDYENEFDRQKEEALKVLQIYKEYNGIGMTIDKYRESMEVTGTGSVN